MRLLRERLTGSCDPLSAARWLRGDERPVVLVGAWAGGGAVLSSGPVRVAGPGEDPFALLDAPAAGIRGEDDPAAADGAVIGGGWFGWLGYGLGARLERLGPAPPRPQPLPAFDLAYHDHLVRCDAGGRWWFEALWTRERDAALQAALARWRERLSAPAPPPAGPWSAQPLRPAGAGLAGHERAVADTVARIAAGELSQANLCLRFEAEFAGDPLEPWLRAVAAARPAYAAFVGGRGHAIASLSPELFLRRSGRTVWTRPIKGTAPAGSDPALLAASAKDRAENVMIVDLMRNDLGRVCAYGSVEVDGLCEIEAAAGVWHLVSTVSGRLRDGVGDGALLRATFPPGSVTGAPKVRAMQVIHALEGTAREAYCGAVGFASPLAGLELNVAIRTLELAGGRVWLGAGGGIVSDSEPAAEVREAMTKAAGIVAAAGLALGGLEPQPATPRPDRRPTLAARLRPDPGAGLIETLRVVDGEAVELEAHLARLAASCTALGLSRPAELAARIAGAAAGHRDAALRVELRANGSCELATRPLPAPGPVTLVPVLVPGGLGAHKWADRALIEAYSAPGQVPLIVDLDGTVLEAGHAAVLIVRDGVLTAPPLDGRQLPSLSRARTLSQAAAAGRTVRIAPFTLGELADADQVLLTSSLRGAHPGLLR